MDIFGSHHPDIPDDLHSLFYDNLPSESENGISCLLDMEKDTDVKSESVGGEDDENGYMFSEFKNVQRQESMDVSSHEKFLDSLFPLTESSVTIPLDFYSSSLHTQQIIQTQGWKYEEATRELDSPLTPSSDHGSHGGEKEQQTSLYGSVDFDFMLSVAEENIDEGKTSISIDEDFTLDCEDSTLVNENISPVHNTPISVSEALAPVNKTTSSINKTLASANKNATSFEKTPTSVIEATTSVNESISVNQTSTAFSEALNSAVEDVTFANEKATPEDETTSAPISQTSVGEIHIPIKDASVPTVEARCDIVEDLKKSLGSSDETSLDPLQEPLDLNYFPGSSVGLNDFFDQGVVEFDSPLPVDITSNEENTQISEMDTGHFDLFNQVFDEFVQSEPKDSEIKTYAETSQLDLDFLDEGAVEVVQSKTNNPSKMERSKNTPGSNVGQFDLFNQMLDELTKPVSKDSERIERKVEIPQVDRGQLDVLNKKGAKISQPRPMNHVKMKEKKITESVKDKLNFLDQESPEEWAESLFTNLQPRSNDSTFLSEVQELQIQTQFQAFDKINEVEVTSEYDDDTIKTDVDVKPIHPALLDHDYCLPPSSQIPPSSLLTPPHSPDSFMRMMKGFKESGTKKEDMKTPQRSFKDLDSDRELSLSSKIRHRFGPTRQSRTETQTLRTSHGNQESGVKVHHRKGSPRIMDIEMEKGVKSTVGRSLLKSKQPTGEASRGEQSMRNREDYRRNQDPSFISGRQTARGSLHRGKMVEMETKGEPEMSMKRKLRSERMGESEDQAMRNTSVSDRRCSPGHTKYRKFEEERELHNRLERQRRGELKGAFETLRDKIPSLARNDKVSKLTILHTASDLCKSINTLETKLSREKQVQMDIQGALREQLFRLQSR